MVDKVSVELRQQEAYRFEATFPGEGIPALVLDEAVPLGGGAGPNPSRLLAAAVGHCLASSLYLCAQKARVPIREIRVRVEATLVRNEKGRLRIGGIAVSIDPVLADPADAPRLGHCREIFEDFCVVTQSVRGGTPVTVRWGGDGGPPPP